MLIFFYVNLFFLCEAFELTGNLQYINVIIIVTEGVVFAGVHAVRYLRGWTVVSGTRADVLQRERLEQDPRRKSSNTDHIVFVSILSHTY